MCQLRSVGCYMFFSRPSAWTFLFNVVMNLSLFFNYFIVVGCSEKSDLYVCCLVFVHVIPNMS